MPYFEEGSPERRRFIAFCSERMAEIAMLQLESIGKITASELSEEQRKDFLRALPVMAKLGIVGSATITNIRIEEESQK